MNTKEELSNMNRRTTTESLFTASAFSALTISSKLNSFGVVGVVATLKLDGGGETMASIT